MINKIICFLLFAFALFLSGQAQADDLFDVYLSMDRLTFSETEDIRLKVSVKNVSSARALFYMQDSAYANPDYTTFQPKVYDMDGRELEYLIDYKRQKKYTTDIIGGTEKRPVVLAPGEVFTYSVDLQRVYEIKNGAFYRVRCYFIPDFSVKHVVYGKNEITFLADERVKFTDRTEAEGAEYANANITPSEVVLLTLEAEKTSARDRMLKFINLEEFIKTESPFIRSYAAAAGEGERRQVIAMFRDYLLRARPDYLLDYKITGEGINGETAFVDVLAERYNVRANEAYRYRYVLQKGHTEGKWFITGLEATVYKGKIK